MLLLWLWLRLHCGCGCGCAVWWRGLEYAMRRCRRPLPSMCLFLRSFRPLEDALVLAPLVGHHCGACFCFLAQASITCAAAS